MGAPHEPVPEQVSTLAVLPRAAADAVREILARRDPNLLEELASVGEPDLGQRERVESVLADELSTRWGPGHSPTPGLRHIEHLIDTFLGRWPIDYDEGE